MPGNNEEKAFLRTNLDNWKKNYYFELSLYGILYAFIPYNLEVENVQYKININGFWITDPYNKECTEDMLNTKLSSLSIPKDVIYHFEIPIIEKTENKIKKVAFQYYNPEAKEVNFVCSVDNWCQYSYPMKKNLDGFWHISKNFSKGVYYYFFFVDGRKVFDFKNENVKWDKKKGKISYFIIE